MDINILSFFFFLARRVISMHRVADFHNVIEIWEPGKQVVRSSTWQRENGNGAHSHHRVLLDSFPFCCSALLGIVMNHWRFMKHGTHTFWKEKHKHSATSGLLRRLRCDWKFVVQGETVSERKQGGRKEKTEIIWFATFCPNLCLTLCWDISDVEKKEEHRNMLVYFLASAWDINSKLVQFRAKRVA